MIFTDLFNRLLKISKKRVIFILFVMSHSVLLLMMLFTFPKINSAMDGPAFDLRSFGYTYGEASEMISRLDASTTQLYMFPQLLLLDVLYPLLLALFLSTFTIRLLSLCKINRDSLISRLFLLPFLAMLFDYAENFCIMIMITNPENLSSEIVAISSGLTTLKSTFTILSWILIALLLVKWRIDKRKEEQELAYHSRT